MLGSSTEVPVSHSSTEVFFSSFSSLLFTTSLLFCSSSPVLSLSFSSNTSSSTTWLSSIPLPTILPLLVVIDLQCSLGLVYVLAENWHAC